MGLIEIVALSGPELEPILRIHGWVHLAPLVLTPGGFRYPLLIGPRTAVTVDVEGRDHSIWIQADRSLPEGQEKQLRQLVRHMLSQDFALGDFVQVCRDRKVRSLLGLARKGWGRMLRSPTCWEDAVKTLCTTNASWGYTQKMCAGLCAVLGHSTRSGLKTCPLPRDVMDAGERVLVHDVGMGYRSRSLLELSERALSGEATWLFDPDQVPEAETAERQILSWHGFGKYATRHLLVLMGFHQYLPIDREVCHHLGIRKRGDKGSDLDSAHFEDWGRFRFTAYKLTRVARRMNWIGD